MDGAAFCIACGSPPPLTSERLCEDCLRARTVFSEVPERIQQHRCAKCGMHEVEKRWVTIEDEELGELRLRENLGVTDGASNVAVDMAYQPIDERTARLHVNVEGQLEGHKFSISMRFYCRLVMLFALPALEKQEHILRRPCSLGVLDVDCLMKNSRALEGL